MSGLGGSFSSVDVIVLPVETEGRYSREPSAKFGTAEPVWSYVAPNPPDLYSNFMPAPRDCPMAITTICSGSNGILSEVTPDKQFVSQYMNPPHTPSPPEGKVAESAAAAEAGQTAARIHGPYSAPIVTGPTTPVLPAKN